MEQKRGPHIKQKWVAGNLPSRHWGLQLQEDLLVLTKWQQTGRKRLDMWQHLAAHDSRFPGRNNAGCGRRQPEACSEVGIGAYSTG